MSDRTPFITAGVLIAAGIAAATAMLCYVWREKVNERRRRWRFEYRPRPPPRDLDLTAYGTAVAKVSKLCLYPVKSCRGIEVDSTMCLVRGLQHDRCWMVADRNKEALSQFGYPTMALVKPTIEVTSEGETLVHLSAPGMQELVVSEADSRDSPTEILKVQTMEGEAKSSGEEAGAWFSTFMKMEGLQLFHMTEEERPRILLEDESWKDYCESGQETSFADFAPLLLTSEPSLALLNSKLDAPVPMERFRPNIVLDSCNPHAEDTWKEVRIGSVLLKAIKPCARCKMTTIDLDLGQFTGQEPMKTLRSYRLYKDVYGEKNAKFNTPLFGHHFSVVQPGTIHVGDTVYIK